MTDTMKSFVVGLIMGLCGKRLILVYLNIVKDMSQA